MREFHKNSLIDWLTSLDFSQTPQDTLRQDVLWQLPDVQDSPCTFNQVFSVQQMQHDIPTWFDPYQMLLNKCMGLPYEIPNEVCEWLDSDDTFATELRRTKWMFTLLTPDVNTPRDVKYPYVCNSKSLLIQLESHLTVGFHCGTWGVWRSPLRVVRSRQGKQLCAKSPVKHLNTPIYTERSRGQWSDIVWQHFNHQSFVSYELEQLLRYARIFIGSERLTYDYDNARLELNDV